MWCCNLRITNAAANIGAGCSSAGGDRSSEEELPENLTVAVFRMETKLLLIEYCTVYIVYYMYYTNIQCHHRTMFVTCVLSPQHAACLNEFG